MSTINQHNYEAFYLDYLEGNLSEEDTAQLKLFLDENPDIKAECDEFEWIELKTPEVKFDKSILHQTINKNNVEEYIFASVEKIIDPDDEIELNDYLNHSAEARSMANRYKKTFLPLRNISFPGKNKLKKRGGAVYYLTPLIGAVAAVFLFFIFNPDLNEKQNLQQQIQFTQNTVTPEHKIDSTLIAAESELLTEKNIGTKKSSDIPILIATTVLNKPVVSIKPATNKSSESSNKKRNPELAKTENLKLLVPVALKQLENNWTKNNNTVLAEMNSQKSEILLVAEEVSLQQDKVPSKRGLNLFKILEFGVKGFNKLNERNYAVIPNYGQTGQLQSVTLITDERTFTTPAI